MNTTKTFIPADNVESFRKFANTYIYNCLHGG